MAAEKERIERAVAALQAEGLIQLTWLAVAHGATCTAL
jgi:hypothetical protein